MNRKSSSSSSAIQFFWDRKSNKNRSRFNLLLLEYGEYLLEDLSAFYFPIPTNDLTTAFEVKDSLKVQGRLKLSTRSLMFEPVEARYPILRFPYKSMTTALEVFNLKESERRELSVDVSGFFTFTVVNSIEMKENNRIGPFKYIDYTATGGQRSVFALVHADLAQFLVKVEQLRHIFNVAQRQGTGAGAQLLKPFLEAAQLWTLQFDTSHLLNFHEKMLLNRPLAVNKIKPLIINPGSLMLTEVRVYFQPSQLNNIGDSVLHFEVRNVARVFRRRYLLQQTGLEFILNDNSSHLFVFDSESLRNMAYGLLLNLRALSPQARGEAPAPGPGPGRHTGGSSGFGSGPGSALDALCRRWQRRELSNFEYLMLLNSEADRSVNDLTQYPVFPHVVADYTSRKLDLDKPSTFRDLSRPIGALNPERLAYFKQRMQSMPPADPSLGIPPPFLYGTHYSTPGYVLHYLVRVAPEYMLCLQNGKFDAPDRMFHNLEGTWQSCLHNPTDLKELIPEFFTGSGEFLVNFEDLDLGHLHTGERLSDVTLPPWADSPRDFIRKHAKALESEYVSDRLHHWIDLIFGYKQQGAAALEADNLYYYLTYEGAVDLDKVTDSRERDALILQIQEFGQTPKQLFQAPHPCRNSKLPTSSITEAGRESPALLPSPSPSPTPMVADVPVHSGATRPRSSSPELPEQPAGQRSRSTSATGPTSTGPTSRAPSSETGPIDAHNRVVEVLQGKGATSMQKGASNSTVDEDDELAAGVAVLDLDDALKAEIDAELRSISGSGGGVGVPLPEPGPLTVAPPLSSSAGHPSHKQRQQTQSPTKQEQQAAAPREKKPTETLLSTVLSWTFGSPSAASQQQRQIKPQVSQVTSPPVSTGPATNGSLPAAAEGHSPSTAEAVLHDGRGNPRKMVMLSSDPYYWHSKAVTGVSALVYPETALVSGGLSHTAGPSQHQQLGTGVGAATEVTHALVASVSRDSNLKVSRVEQIVSGKFQRDGPGEGLRLQASVLQTNVSPRRTNNVSSSSLSAVCLLRDMNHILFSSWDNSIYGYSVSHAHTVCRTYAHDDAVTCMSLCSTGTHLLTGSLDATVKLWRIQDPAQASDPRTASGTLISSAPLAVFPEVDSPVQCVAIDGAGRMGAAGSDDGSVVVWDLHHRSFLSSTAVSSAKRPVHCLLWASNTGADEPSLLCGCDDGWLVLLSARGQRMAATKLEASGAAAQQPRVAPPARGLPHQGQQGAIAVHVRCLQAAGDPTLVFGGCSDGSIRCWLRSESHLEEVYRHAAGHVGPVCSLSLASTTAHSNNAVGRAGSHRSHKSFDTLRDTQMLISASEDCSVKVWRVYCSGDY